MSNIVFSALGGLQEVGANCYLYGVKSSNNYIMVDLGVGFKDPKYNFLESFFPDLGYLKHRKRKLQALFVTHGHEDHIGAIEYHAEFLQDVPIYATAFTADLLKQKLRYHRHKGKKLTIIPVVPGGTAHVGDFSVKFIPIEHSIPEANMLLIQTDHANVLHSGDFRINPQTFEPAHVRKYLPKRIDYFMCESTNANKNRAYEPETNILPALTKAMEQAKSTVWLTMFSSNVMRLGNVLEVSQKCGRKVVFLGRSLQNYYDIALKNNYIKPSPNIVAVGSVGEYKPLELMFLVTGSQGEHNSFLQKLLNDQVRVPGVKLKKGDTLIFLSKPIPGNEIKVADLMNKLAIKEVNMITAEEGCLHVSGHAYRPEIETLIQAVQPNYIIPIHGENLHLKALERIAKSLGCEAQVVNNGDLIELAPKKPKLLDNIHWGKMSYEGWRNVSLQDTIFAQRRKCMFDGVVTINLLVKRGLIAEVALNIVGLFTKDELQGHEIVMIRRIEQLNDQLKNGTLAKSELDKAAKSIVKKFIRDTVGKKPIILPYCFYV